MNKKKVLVGERKSEEKNLVITKNKKILTRGRTFEGKIIKKFPKRIVIELPHIIFVPKLERFYKKKICLHARLPEDLDANVGDKVIVQECRPLSKIIHFMALKVTKKADTPKEDKK